MVIIVDSGSTKAHWAYYIQDSLHIFETKGMSPYFVDADFVFQELNHSEAKDWKEDVAAIHFYGTGCSHEKMNEKLKTILKDYFTNAVHIEVKHDMMAACIALFGSQKGLACILGTGSNSCVYNGAEITANIPAPGFVLGDEAGGAFLGKSLLRAFIYKKLSPQVMNYLENEMNLKEVEIYENIYSKPQANRYLASFAPVLYQFKSDESIQKILQNAFEEFITFHILDYPQYKELPIAAVGSVAFYFQEEFDKALKKYDLSLSHVEKEPITALAKFHYGMK
jgi:N-acetylglucosamine kinase-like BadF-type ATPase